MHHDTTIDEREVEASGRLVEAFDPAMIDSLSADTTAAGTPIDGPLGLLNRDDQGGAGAGIAGRNNRRTRL